MTTPDNDYIKEVSMAELKQLSDQFGIDDPAELFNKVVERRKKETQCHKARVTALEIFRNTGWMITK